MGGGVSVAVLCVRTHLVLPTPSTSVTPLSSMIGDKAARSSFDLGYSLVRCLGVNCGWGERVHALCKTFWLQQSPAYGSKS